MSKDANNNGEFDFSDPTKLWREGYDQFWKQAGQQWQQMAGNPQFLSVMNLAMEQSLMLTRRMHELIATTLKTMNIPTAQDFQAVNARLDQLANRVEAMARQNNAVNMANFTAASTAATAKTPKTPKPTPTAKSNKLATAAKSNAKVKSATANKVAKAATKPAKASKVNKSNKVDKSIDSKE
jgi:outer membrane murein-binding lipoprotein Lpp